MFEKLFEKESSDKFLKIEKIIENAKSRVQSEWSPCVSSFSRSSDGWMDESRNESG